MTEVTFPYALVVNLKCAIPSSSCASAPYRIMNFGLNFAASWGTGLLNAYEKASFEVRGWQGDVGLQPSCLGEALSESLGIVYIMGLNPNGF